MKNTQNPPKCEPLTLTPIGYAETDFKEKFGIPRQSGRAGLLAKIHFYPEYAVEDAFRGLDGFSHVWILFDFSKSHVENFSPTVRPPRLGGNKRVGVFATRSPFRPNAIGLSSVKLISIEETETEGTVLIVGGADMLDGTPIYDIKPYVAYSDSHPDAISGFADPVKEYKLNVDFCKELLAKVAPEKQKSLILILEQDPRPSYQNDPDREYGMRFADYEVFFKVAGETLTVTNVIKK